MIDNSVLTCYNYLSTGAVPEEFSLSKKERLMKQLYVMTVLALTLILVGCSHPSTTPSNQ